MNDKPKTFVQGACPVVRIKSDNPEHEGFIEINAEDFDAESGHVIFTDADAAKRPKPAPKPSPLAADLTKSGAPVLVGVGDAFPPAIDVGRKRAEDGAPWPMLIEEIVLSAFKRSKLNDKQWNKMTADQRKQLVEAEIKLLLAAFNASEGKTLQPGGGWQ